MQAVLSYDRFGPLPIEFLYTKKIGNYRIGTAERRSPYVHTFITHSQQHGTVTNQRPHQSINQSIMTDDSRARGFRWERRLNGRRPVSRTSFVFFLGRRVFGFSTMMIRTAEDY